MPSTVTDVLFQGGLNQSIGEPHRQPSDLLLAVNVRQNKTGALDKRPGNIRLGQTALTPGGNVAKLLVLGNDVCVAQTPTGFGSVAQYFSGAQSYSPSSVALGGAAFQGSRLGGEASLTRKTIDCAQDISPSSHGPNGSVTNLAMRPAMAFGAGFYAYVTVDVQGFLLITLEDAVSGVSVLSRVQTTVQTANAAYALPLIVGNTLIIVYRESASALIKGFSMNLAAIGSGFGNLTTLATDAWTAGNGVQFDLVVNGANFTLGYISTATTNSIQWATFTTAFAAVGSRANVVVVGVIGMSMAIGSGLLATSYHTSTGLHVGVIVLTSTLFAVSGPTTLSTATGPGSPQNSGVVVLDGSHVTVIGQLSLSDGTTFVSAFTINAGTGAILNNIGQAYRCCMLSKPFLNNGLVYGWVQQVAAGPGSIADNVGKTNVLVEYTGTAVALAGTVTSTLTARPVASSCNRFAGPAQYIFGTGATLPGAYPQSVVSPSPGVFEVVLPFLESVNSGFFARGTSDFAATSRWISSTLGGLLTTNSGPSVYDHANLTEVGFHTVAAQAPSVSATGTTGTLAAGTYYWSYCYRYQDATGNTHRSQPSTPISLTVSATNTATVSVPTVQLSCRNPFLLARGANQNDFFVYVEIYRSQVNPAIANGITIPMNLSSVTPINSAGSRISIQDAANTAAQSDAQILANAALYTEGGVLPNVAPPSLKAICSHKSRLFGIADDGATIYFSKQYTAGEAINFCDGMTIQIDDVVNLTALASLDGNLIIFSDQSIYYLVGSGPGDNGQGSDYDIPQRIASDVGCINPNSVVVTPAGVMFESPIGIYLLDRGLNVTWLGQPVVDELPPATTIVGATLHPTNPWVYFQAVGPELSGGTIRLVYDYRIDKWYTDQLPSIPIAMGRTSSTIFYYDTAGFLWSEDTSTTVFTDNGAWVTSDFEVAWSHPASLQGFQTTRQALLLGQKFSGHDLQIRSRSNYRGSYDADQTWTDVPTSPPALPVGTVLVQPEQFALAIEREQQAVTVRVTDFPPSTGSSIGTGRGARFYGITYEIDPIDGAFRVDSAQQGG